ncbi:hypothetical protein HMPREF0812_00893 [Streptococcus agalactiae]|nr:hypothetical protein HMPREF0812_00893 [Streptococcus agalactiae]
MASRNEITAYDCMKKVFEKQNFSKTYQNQLSWLYHILKKRE